MNPERELLIVALDFLDPRRWLDPADQHVLNILTRDIEELLAQPEQKLMTDRAIIQACPDHYCDMEKEAFKVGIKWYEKYVARIGVYSNE